MPAELLVDDGQILNTLIDVCKKNDVNIINTIRYRFGADSPPGCTAIVTIDESHISVHTYADDGKMAMDIFTCGTRTNADQIWEDLKNKFQISNFKIQTIDRF
jgi:S-adenosylmethionine decarboxylase